MLWTILVILLVLWLLGLIGGIGGGLIHLLLVIAAIVLLFQLLVRSPRGLAPRTRQRRRDAGPADAGLGVRLLPGRILIAPPRDR